MANRLRFAELARQGAGPQPAARSLVSALSAATAGGADVGLQLEFVDPRLVAAHPGNPRDKLTGLDELAASMREVGVLSPPLTMRREVFLATSGFPSESVPVEATHVTLGGHRRTAAAILAELAEIPVIVKGPVADDGNGAIRLLVDNLHRQDFEPLEEAMALQLIAESSGLSQREIARRVGVSQSHVAKRLSLLKLPDVVQEAIRVGRLMVTDALTLLNVAEPDRLLVWELAERRNVPIESAAAEYARAEQYERARAKARRRAERERVAWVERPEAEFRDGPHRHRLYDKAEIEHARTAGRLRASADAQGNLVYFSTTPRAQSMPGAEDEAARKAAVKARTAFLAGLVQQRRPAAEMQRAVVELTLTGGLAFADALKLTHRWLGDSAGITHSDPYRWRDQVLTALSKEDRLWVAWVMTVAQQELRARERYRSWTEADRSYLAWLMQAGYEPTAWEQAKLASIEAGAA